MKRTCTKCKVEKTVEDFYKNISYFDGYSTWCKKCYRQKRKEYREKNKEKIEKYRKENYIPKPRILVSKEDKVLKKKERRKRYRKVRAKRQKERLNTEPLFKLKRNLRNRIWGMMKGSKSESTEELLGCTFEEVKQHIENQFIEGMSWENYGQWHVDHKIPLSSATNEKELKELFKYKNLQPLWAIDNCIKSNKII